MRGDWTHGPKLMRKSDIALTLIRRTRRPRRREGYRGLVHLLGVRLHEIAFRNLAGNRSRRCFERGTTRVIAAAGIGFLARKNRRLDVVKKTVAAALSQIANHNPAPPRRVVARSDYRRGKERLICHEEVRVALVSNAQSLHYM